MDSLSQESGGIEPATGINKKASDFSKALSGMDGTRTRDLLRDRQAF